MAKEDKIENLYLQIVNVQKAVAQGSVPYIRRLLRFLALPYCYARVINWDDCKESRIKVISDLLYIFFVLKYYPDNYSLCQLWKRDRSEWAYYYGSIYDPYQRGRLRREVQPQKYEVLFEDKYICYQLCKAGGFPLPQQFGLIFPESNYKTVLMEILDAMPDEKMIIKPVDGKGGAGIHLAYKVDDGYFIKDLDKEFPLGTFNLSSRSVVQKYIYQHEEISKIAASTNTIRIVTLLKKNRADVLIVGAMMKFGAGDAFIDNRSRGGMATGINLEDGTLHKYAYDFQLRIHKFHPVSGVSFEGTAIPHWQQVVTLVKEVQRAFPFYMLLGHDIAITPEGPVLIEINAAHDNVGLEQAYGPILRRQDIAAQFREYDLLINKPSRENAS